MRLGASIVVLGILFISPCTLCSQCSAPELVKGADKYNESVCKGYAAEKRGDNSKALRFFLAASQLPVLESPNIRLFGHIALAYARGGQFDDSERYLAYDNLSILWMIGIVRCQQGANSNDEVLVQDGKLLASDEANRLSRILCGPVFDEYSYFRQRDAESFTPAARAILRHGELRKEIFAMKSK